MTRTVRVPAVRVETWFANFEAGHGTATYAVVDGALTGLAEDGSTVRARLPFGRRVESADPAALPAGCAAPEDWGVLLVRKGGFAVARLRGDLVVGRKVGQRHVQGRTKAGGQSQQRFARRRANQADAAYEAAAGHAARLLAPPAERPVAQLVVGGDQNAVDAVLADRRLSVLRDRVVAPLLDVPDPRGRVLDAATADATSLLVQVHNA